MPFGQGGAAAPDAVVRAGGAVRVDVAGAGRRVLPALWLSLRLAGLMYLSAAGGLLFWSHAPVVLGWQPRVVLSGSMGPVIRVGDVVLLAPVPAGDPLPAGRVVLVTDPTRSSGTYLHRVVRRTPDGSLVTRGDANASEDRPAVERSRVQGQLRLLVPRVGLPVIWWREGRYAELAAAALGTWAAALGALGLRASARRAARHL
jgi:signal peptidase